LLIPLAGKPYSRIKCDVKIYKYLATEYAERLVNRGEMLFRSLSYFRDLEDGGVRQDEFEGTLRHRPKGGLVITKESGEQVTLPHRFESIAKEEAIFVYCFSTELDPSLAQAFGADACVEISNPIKLLSKVKSAIRLRSAVKEKLVPAGLVRYYEDHDPPIVDWALPEKIAMAKRAGYSSQHEYRIAFAEGDAFSVENVQVQLVEENADRHTPNSEHSERLLKLGDLSKICNTHLFKRT
jgi:hypothetical protein